MGFSGCPLTLERLGPGQYRLARPLVYRERINGGGIEVTVPAGFETDFASIPRLLWGLYPPDGSYALPAVAHDYLYRRCGCSRFLADAMFRDMMRAERVPLVRRMLIYYAVRCFGWLFRRRDEPPPVILARAA